MEQMIIFGNVFYIFIKINAHYEFYQSEWKLKWANVTVGWNSTELDKEKISDVLSNTSSIGD